MKPEGKLGNRFSLFIHAPPTPPAPSSPTRHPCTAVGSAGTTEFFQSFSNTSSFYSWSQSQQPSGEGGAPPWTAPPSITGSHVNFHTHTHTHTCRSVTSSHLPFDVGELGEHQGPIKGQLSHIEVVLPRTQRLKQEVK